MSDAYQTLAAGLAAGPLIIQTKQGGLLDGTTPDDVRQIAAAVASAERAVLHVHGGLVSAARALEKATRLNPVYRASEIVPVFPVWESGLLEVLRHHGGEIFAETIFQLLLKFILKHAGGKILEMPGARGTVPYVPLSDREAELALEQARNAENNVDAAEPLSNVQPTPGQQDLTPQLVLDLR